MAKQKTNRLKAGIVGMGMIAEETYRPMFETLHAGGLYRKDFGHVDVRLGGVATVPLRAPPSRRRAGSVSERYAPSTN